MADTSGSEENRLDIGDKNLHNSSIISDYSEDLNIAPECLMEASKIRAIDKASVHRICSGQVVLTLATAVKELVENSIDAGASCVEIKLKDYGCESIEVTDNGSGVEEKDFEGLTLKHHTSKLQDFNDLVNVTSFGFRGEALSSLCALSNMAITTRHKSAAVGTRLEFDLNGKIVSRKSAPRQVGSTVQVHNIFHSLPVRHKEFHRNVKKEFSRLVHVLNAYCLISTGVRISCTNQSTKGSRSTVVSTNGNESMRDNIANIFSPKQLQSLLEFQQVEANDEVCSDFGIKLQHKSSMNFRITGFVSRCEHGQGRSSTDRQFIFINQRPCDHTKILKLINEVYHGYNRHQSPFIALSIFVEKESVDVNVTPDKRQIFLEGENLLLATLKTSLIKMFEPTTSIYRVNTLPSVKQSYSLPGGQAQGILACSDIQVCSGIQDSDTLSLSSSLSRLKRSFSSAFARSDSPISLPADMKAKSTFSTALLGSQAKDKDASTNHGAITQFFSKLSPKKSINMSPAKSLPPDTDTELYNRKTVETKEDVRLDMVTHKEKILQKSLLPCEVSDGVSSSMFGPGHTRLCPTSEVGDTSDTRHVACRLENDSHSRTHGDPEDQSLEQNCQPSELADGLSECMEGELEDAVGSHNISTVRTTVLEVCDDRRQREETHTQNCETEEIFITDLDLVQEGHGEHKKRERKIAFCLASLRKQIHSDASSPGSGLQFIRSFRAKICPTDNRSAEDELQKEISKDMFDKMEILGQFNLGFIITKLGRDLFIIDQHATDEKYNFEMLQRGAVLHTQKLIIPQSLGLTASNETILMDNLDVFKKNGFDFLIDAEAPPTERVRLVSAPVSKNWSFGKDDIEELLFMLSDSPNVMCRPSRVRLMFASRACRKSVMIGTALNKYEMKQLVAHMGQIEQPWNCPHGRPTMRHLFNLDMLPSSNSP